jgi:methyl-accepting chemotaxis protein
MHAATFAPRIGAGGMFPKSFRATVDQRLKLWGGLMGLLACLFGATEFIGSSRLEEFSHDLRLHIAAVDAIGGTTQAYQELIEALGADDGRKVNPADIASIVLVLQQIAASPDADVRQRAEEAWMLLEVVGRHAGSDRVAARTALRLSTLKRNELRTAINAAVAGVTGRLAYQVDNARQNKILISTLGLFLVILIASFEYRWLVRPVIGMARALGSAEQDRGWLGKIAMRRDEIGMLGRALLAHQREERAKEEAAASRLSVLAAEITQRDHMQAQSAAFQDRIAGIASAMEQHAARMSRASGELANLSSFLDAQANAAAQSTHRASSHVDDVARSIAEVSQLLANTAGEAQTTSQVAETAKALVAAAASDNATLTAAISGIGQVMDIIESVASQTNLLALNATIEAAHAGEAGRGFAVVASEVKQLASQTAGATEEVRRGLAAVRQAARGMSERVGALVGAVDQVDRAAATIADLAQRQDMSSRSISTSTDQTAGDVRLAAEQVGKVAGMVETWRRTGEAVTLASADLDRQAEELREAVGGFITQTQRASA